MFNPFGKKINELSIEDLRILKEREIKEGFYVEYKSTFPRPEKIARSVASFANTYGGWYFVGIESNEKNIPVNFRGFSLTDYPTPLEHVRNIIRDHIDPFPLYYSKLIQVENEKAILVLQIPESYETPHITKDGRIYRRNSEGSDPVPETNRYVLDKLYEKSARLQEEIEFFCRREIAISQAEEKNGWIEIYAMPYPLNQLSITQFFEKTFVDNLKNKMNEPTRVELTENTWFSTSIPFNIASAGYRSIIFRQTSPGTLALMGLTFQLFINGNAKIIIPFQYIPFNSELNSVVWKKLIEALEKEDGYLFRFIDGLKMLIVFVVLLEKYFDILKSQGWQDDILIAYRLENTWRTILFFDISAFSKHIDKYGIPVCQRYNTQIPKKLLKEYMITKMPENGIFHLIEFLKISSHFGIFPHEAKAFVKEWLEKLQGNMVV